MVALFLAAVGYLSSSPAEPVDEDSRTLQVRSAELAEVPAGDGSGTAQTLLFVTGQLLADPGDAYPRTMVFGEQEATVRLYASEGFETFAEWGLLATFAPIAPRGAPDGPIPEAAPEAEGATERYRVEVYPTTGTVNAEWTLEVDLRAGTVEETARFQLAPAPAPAEPEWAEPEWAEPERLRPKSPPTEQ